MSFRLRVLGLLMLVAVSATAATAWLTLRQASEQITESATADQAQLDEVVRQLAEYGSRHGTWEGVPTLVQDLRARTGQRIHLVAESGEVIVDTDTLERRISRPLGTMTGFVDPRPVLDPARLPADPAARPGIVVNAVASYRVGVLLAACLTRHDLPVTRSPGSLGVPSYAADLRDAELADRPDSTTAAGDYQAAAALTKDDRDVSGDVARVELCGTATAYGSLDSCLARAFTDQISDVAPVPARVYLGARDEPALSDGVITPDQNLFASLHEEAVLQQRIVDDLQDLALAEAGNLAYHRVPVDLAELLETCGTAHHARAESAGVSLRVAVEPVAVHADPDRLRQVVGNLVTNALRATAAGGGVRLVASRTDTQAIVQVVDTGLENRGGRAAARVRPVLAGRRRAGPPYRGQWPRPRHRPADRHRSPGHHHGRE